MIRNILFIGFICSLLTGCNKFQYSSSTEIKHAIQSTVKISVEYVADDKITLSSTYKAYWASGFSIITDPDKNKSYILTNKHVCEMRQRANYELTLSDGSIMKAKYVLSDSFADICLLEANGVLSPLVLASQNATQGERIITMGAPDGAFPIVVDGLVCGYHDMHMQADSTDDGPFEVNFRAQIISAPIYQGSSGSPVLNVDGKVVGIIFAVRTNKEHIAFMVPISEVLRFLDRSEYVHMN